MTTPVAFSDTVNQPTISMGIVIEEQSDDIGYLSVQEYPELKQLNIIGLPGRSFAEYSIRSPIVEDLVLTDCDNLVSLSGIEEFTSLKRLWLCNCPSVDFNSTNLIDIRVVATGDGFEALTLPVERLFSQEELDETEEQHFVTFYEQQEQQQQQVVEEEEKDGEETSRN